MNDTPVTAMPQEHGSQELLWCVVYFLVELFLVKVAVKLAVRRIFGPCRSKNICCFPQGENGELLLSCCPKRVARFRKCAKKRRRRKATEHHGCVVAQSLRSISKIFLPPPLPIRTKSSSSSSNEKKNTESLPTYTESNNNTTLEETDASRETIIAHDDDIPQKDPEKDQDATLPTVPHHHPTTTHSTAAAHLIDMVRMQQWDTLLHQPHLKRRQAKYRDGEGLYPLHWAAAGPAPPAVVDRLLETYASAISRADAEGSLPLHFAAHYGACTQSVERLYTAYPWAAQRQDQYGRTPLYHAVDKLANLDVLKILSQDNLAVITTPCYTRQGASDRERAIRTPLYMMWSAVLWERRTHGKQWDKAVWLLLQASHYHHDHKAPPSLLTACITMDLYLPEPAVSVVLLQHSSSADTPLALITVVSTPSYSLSRALFLVRTFLAAPLDKQDAVYRTLKAAMTAGQPWALLEVLFQHHRAPQGGPWALWAASATPIQYSQTEMTPPEQLDPLGLMLFGKQTPRVLETTTDEREEVEDHPRDDHLDTIYQLLRREPWQLQQYSL